MSIENNSISLFNCSFKPILEYIDTQFENYLEEELKIKRSLFSCHDTRIHACLYFIAPSGHSLKSLDLVTMKKLDSKVTTRSVHHLPFLVHHPSSCYLLFLNKGKHHPHHCEGGHCEQERTGQAEDQDHERAGQ